MEGTHGPGGVGPFEPNKPIKGKKGFKREDLPKSAKEPGKIEPGLAIKSVRMGEAKAGGHDAIAELKKDLGSKGIEEVKEHIADRAKKMDDTQLAESIAGAAKLLTLCDRDQALKFHAEITSAVLQPKHGEILGDRINRAVADSPEEYLSEIRNIAPKEE